MTATRRQSRDYAPQCDLHQQPRCCDVPGCDKPGEYRAPRSRNNLLEYYWFCLDHVREYNRSWNYLSGLSDVEVERMVRQDTVWQRPSWPFGGPAAAEARLRQRVYRDFAMGDDIHHDERRFDQPAPQAGTEADRALATFDLSWPVDFATVKARYKALVKRHHPDANGGSRDAEEALKTINQAYAVLKASFAS